MENEKWKLSKILGLIINVREQLASGEITAEHAESVERGAISLACPEDIERINAAITSNPLIPTTDTLLNLKKKVLEGEGI